MQKNSILTLTLWSGLLYGACAAHISYSAEVERIPLAQALFGNHNIHTPKTASPEQIMATVRTGILSGKLSAIALRSLTSDASSCTDESDYQQFLSYVMDNALPKLGARVHDFLSETYIPADLECTLTSSFYYDRVHLSSTAYTYLMGSPQARYQFSMLLLSYFFQQATTAGAGLHSAHLYAIRSLMSLGGVQSHASGPVWNERYYTLPAGCLENCIIAVCEYARKHHINPSAVQSCVRSVANAFPLATELLPEHVVHPRPDKRPDFTYIDVVTHMTQLYEKYK